MFDRLDHDDRIIDDETDREHETEERERVDTKAEERKEHERANERHGHGTEWDQGRAALQEDKDHEDYEHECLDERLDDLVDAGCDGARRIERDGVSHVGRKLFGYALHQRLHTLGRLQRIGAGELVKRKDSGLLAVKTPAPRVGLRAELDARDILHAQQRAIRVGADDHLFELLDTRQAAGCARGVGKLLPGWRGIAADLSGRIHRVLGAHGGDDV